MAIWYWDPVGGNNTNDGTTFANRKLNLQNLTTVAAGDTVRCIKSPDAVNTGINATWTDGSNTVTLASAQTLLVSSCDTNWTASSNVTCTATATGRKEGTFCQQTAVAAAFTTGKASYFATGTLNCSGYQQLTFWITQTAGTLAVAGDYTMSLCSDVAGVTQVNNFPIPAVGALNQPFPVTIDLGTNLGASIQSIAFYVNVDRAAVTFNFDNINVALASSTASAITCTSLIGKGGTDNQYLGIRSINGTTVILDSAPQYTLDLAGTEPTWSGTTETVALYRRETLKTVQGTAIGTIINNYAGATGSVGNIVTISGGWDTTNMSTQTGQTYLDGSNGLGYGLQIGANTSLAYLNTSNINCYRYYYGLYHQSSNSAPNNTITGDNFNNNSNTGIYIPGNCKNLTLTINNINKNGYNATNGYGLQYIFSTSSKLSVLLLNNLNSNWINGIVINGAAFTGTLNITNANRNSFDGVLAYSSVGATFNITNLLYNSSINGANSSYGQISFISLGNTYGVGGLTPSTVGNHDNIINLTNITNTANTSAGIVLGLAADNNKINILGAFNGFNSGSYNSIISPYGGTNYITSSSAIFSTSTQWASVSGNAKLYISTADIITPGITVQVGSTAQIVVKNAYGIQGQSYVAPATSWGLN